MAKFKTPGQIVAAGSGRTNMQFQIVEPRCKICNHPNRREIDMMLALGWSQASVMRHWNYVMELEGTDEEDLIKKNSISTHAQKHLSIKDGAVHRIISERAKIEGIDIETVEGFILTKQGVAEALVAAGLESLHRGNTTVEPKDILVALKTLSDLEKDREAIAEEQMLQEIRAFTTAVKRVVPEEQWELIYEIYEQELGRVNLAIMPPVDYVVEDAEEVDEENLDQLTLFEAEEYENGHS